MTLRRIAGLLVLCLGVASAACAPIRSRTEAANQIAYCPVCTHNNDLACETVEVDATTPTVTYAGKSYHFCSEHCRATFLEKPEAFLSE